VDIILVRVMKVSVERSFHSILQMMVTEIAVTSLLIANFMDNDTICFYYETACSLVNSLFWKKKTAQNETLFDVASYCIGGKYIRVG